MKNIQIQNINLNANSYCNDVLNLVKLIVALIATVTEATTRYSLVVRVQDLGSSVRYSAPGNLQPPYRASRLICHSSPCKRSSCWPFLSIDNEGIYRSASGVLRLLQDLFKILDHHVINLEKYTFEYY